MNETIELLKSHRSIRKFKNKKIDKDLLNQILLLDKQQQVQAFFKVFNYKDYR